MKELLAHKAAPWSYFVGGLGQTFIFLAIALCLASAVLMVLRRERLAKPLFTVGSLSFLGAFGCLLSLFLRHQYQFQYVYDHSASDHSVQYLVAGVWAGQQGSFLLWGLMAGVAGAIAARGTGEYRRWFTVVYGVFLASLAAINAYETPFALTMLEQSRDHFIHVVPFDGRGLVPSLLNYWIVIHPPTIFLGFGTLTVLFCYAFSALLSRNVTSWIPMVRPWAAFALAVLGVGLCMGGFWAYETLGWGGFWMWDPVENTSFVPWCAVVAFVHGMFVQQARKKWFFANVMFGALPFVLFCYGTLLTRSGWLGESSVHGFAKMNANALVLLICLSAVGLVSFVTVLVATWGDISSKLPKPAASRTAFLSRETFYGIGTWLVWAFAFVTALGMSYPLLLRAMGKPPKIIGEHLYHQVLAWVFPPLMIAMAVAPFLNWNGLSLRELFSRITNSLAVSIGLVGVLLLWLKSPGFFPPGPNDTIHFWDFAKWTVKVPTTGWVLFLTWLCLFVAIASFWRLFETWKRSKQSVAAMLAHFGVAMALLGLVFSRGFEVKQPVWLHPSENPMAFGHSLVSEGQTSKFSDRDNKIAIRATELEPMQTIAEGEPKVKDSFVAKPGLYYFLDANGKPKAMQWPSIIHKGLIDYYFAIGEPEFKAVDATPFVLSADPKNNPDVKAHTDVVLTYDGYEIHGSIAEDGVSMLVAKMTAVTAEDSYKLEPAVIVRPGQQIVPVQARIGDEYNLTLLSMNPDTHAIMVQLEYIQPAYPMEVYFKPLTLFVWLGVGIMGVGGLLAALVRRKERQANATETAA